MPMEKIFETIATLACGIFTGAAVYINLVEHPARMQCGTGLAATEFAPSYRRASVTRGSPGGYRFCSRNGSLVNGRQFLVVGGRSPSRFRDSIHFYIHYAHEQEITDSGPGQGIRNLLSIFLKSGADYTLSGAC